MLLSPNMATNTSISTPSYNHLTSDDFDRIYSPSEDSFLLIDAFEKDLDEILNLKPDICLEIGIGSGVVVTALGAVLRNTCKYLGTDINPFACKKAAETAAVNGICLETYCCDLASGIPNEFKGKVDILIFNPPYVVTESEEISSGLLESSWAGGKKGREVMDRLFPQLSVLLSSKGIFYLLLEKKNCPEEVFEILKQLGFSHEYVLKRKNVSEQLSVVKFKRN